MFSLLPSLFSWFLFYFFDTCATLEVESFVVCLSIRFLREITPARLQFLPSVLFYCNTLLSEGRRLLQISEAGHS